MHTREHDLGMATGQPGLGFVVGFVLRLHETVWTGIGLVVLPFYGAGLARPELRPGTLSLFRGQRSLHHVTRVAGARPRLIALFSYDRRPGMWFPDEVRRGVYGRLG